MKVAERAEIDLEVGFAYNQVLGGGGILSDRGRDMIGRIRAGELSEAEAEAFDAETLERLRGSWIVRGPNDPTEKEIVEGAVEKYLESVASLGTVTKLLLMVTHKCMLACKYCYVEDAGACCPDSPADAGQSQLTMDWPTARQSIDLFYAVVKRAKQSEVHVRFHGGEPLLNMQLIEKSVRYIEDNYSDTVTHFRTNTNGVLMTPAIAEFMGRHRFFVEVSVDGPQAIHDTVRKFPDGRGSYNHAIEAVRMLQEARVPTDRLNFACTLSRVNAEHLSELIDLSADMGLSTLEINVFYFPHELDLLDEVDKRVDALLSARTYGLKKAVDVTGKPFKLMSRVVESSVLNYCGRFGQQIGVDANGQLIGCTGNFSGMGDVSGLTADSFHWPDEYMEIAGRVVGTIPECSGCEIEGMCAGGCVAAVLQSGRKLSQSDAKECQFRKKMVKRMIEEHSRIANNEIGLESVDRTYYPVLTEYTGLESVS